MTRAALPYPLNRVLTDQQPEQRLQRVWRGVRASREARPRVTLWASHRRLILVATCWCCAVISTAWAWRWAHRESDSAAVRTAIPTSVAPTVAPREVDLGGGALVTVAPGAHLDVLEHSERSVVLALRRGLSQFEIRPGGTRHFSVESAGVTVEVVGTRFSMQRTQEGVRVEVQRGRVLVRGSNVPDQVLALDAGQSLTVALTSSPSAEVRPTRDTLNPSEIAGSAIPPATPLHATGDVPHGTWRKAATEQHWHQAWQSLGAAGVARETARVDDVQDLLALADVARLSGHPRDALAPLRQILSSHSMDPRAAMAAFTLGRVLHDSLGESAQAAVAFERALALRLPAALAEDAAARLVQAHANSGASAQAKTAADAYRSRYPAGRRTGDVNRWSPP